MRASRMLVPLGVALIGLWGANCGSQDRGGSGSTVNPDGGPGSGGGDAGSTDAGGASSDGGSTGSADAGGSGGSGGSGDAGSGGGTGGADAGGGTGSADAGGGGTATSDCDGIRPAGIPDPSATAQVPHGDTEVCWSATSDGNGYVLGEAHNPNAPPGLSLHWVIFAPGGGNSGTLQGVAAAAPQPSGFETTYVYFDDSAPEPQNEAATLWSDTGEIQKRVGLGSDFCGVQGAFRVPGGGSIALVECGAGPKGNLGIFRLDAGGNLIGHAVWGIQFPDSTVRESFAAVGDTAGNTLIVGHPGSMVGLAADDYAAQWFDSSGSALTPIFSAAKGSGEAILRPLVSGEVALQIDGVWKALLSAGSTDARPVPDWLASHDHFDFEIVRGGRAYALIPRNGAPDTKTLELVTPKGESCGTTSFPIGGLSVGFDGTVIAASGNAGCTKTWWSGLLK